MYVLMLQPPSPNIKVIVAEIKILIQSHPLTCTCSSIDSKYEGQEEEETGWLPEGQVKGGKEEAQEW